MGRHTNVCGPLPELYYYDRKRVVPLTRSVLGWSAFCLDQVGGIFDQAWLDDTCADYEVSKGYVALPDDLISSDSLRVLRERELLLPVFDHERGTVVVLPAIYVHGSSDQRKQVLDYLTERCAGGFDHRLHGDDPTKPASMDIWFRSRSGLEAYLYSNKIVEDLGVQSHPHFLNIFRL